jgi:NADH-quinone oxidoreductase subunit N
VLTIVAKGGKEGTRLKDLTGLWSRSPWAAISLVIFMVSLIGIPPSAGFFAKLQIFREAVTANLWALAIVLAINSAISCYYYLGIAMAVFVNEPAEDAEPISKMKLGLGLTTGICVAGILAAVILYTPLNEAMVGPDGGIQRSTLVEHRTEAAVPVIQ